MSRKKIVSFVPDPIIDTTCKYIVSMCPLGSLGMLEDGVNVVVDVENKNGTIVCTADGYKPSRFADRYFEQLLFSGHIVKYNEKDSIINESNL